MANYKLHKKGKTVGKAVVAPEGIDIHVPALIICALIAFGIWLYIVGISHMVEDYKAPEETTPQDNARVETVVPYPGADLA